MTDAEIVKVMAERFDGIENPQPYAGGGFWGRHTKSGQIGLCSNYLADRNALARVIREMETSDQALLRATILDYFADNIDGSFCIWLLTCDPRVIAECVARAIHAAKGGG